jgi:hypothetical protein
MHLPEALIEITVLEVLPPAPRYRGNIPARLGLSLKYNMKIEK